VLSNGGTQRGLPISCFLNEASDSLEGIVGLWNENVWLASKGGGIGSYWGNLRSIGEKVGAVGKTSGVIPFIRVMDSLTLAISQGSLRRGSAAVYLPVWHPEIEEFVEIRRPTGGDPNRKALNLHHGILVSDAFMRAVEADEQWALLSPKDETPVRSISARALWVLYFTMVAVMGLSLYLSYFIKSSKFGLGLLAIGQNEDAAAILGVPTPFYKALVYSASAFLPAIAGGVYFFKSAFIQPADAFDLSLSTEALVVAMLGGQGTVTGVALGAYLYEELRGYLLTSDTFSNFQLVISGALLLLIVLFFPGGLMGWIYSRFPRTQKVLE